MNQMLNKPEYKMTELGAKAYFRIPEPWHPVTKRILNATRGKGKPPINMWVTPIKGAFVLT